MAFDAGTCQPLSQNPLKLMHCSASVCTMQDFWKVLGPNGFGTWQSSARCKLECPGSVTHAKAATCPEGAIRVALTTKEEPHRLHVVQLNGNPIASNATCINATTDATVTEAARAVSNGASSAVTGMQAVQLGRIELGQLHKPLLEICFLPHSAGELLRDEPQLYIEHLTTSSVDNEVQRSAWHRVLWLILQRT